MASSSFFKNNGTSSQLQGSASASAAAALASEQAALASENAAQTSETSTTASAAAALVSKNAAANSAASANSDASAAATSATASQTAATSSSANAALTSADATQTAADRVQTGLDRVATSADAVQTAADRVQTGLDVTSTTNSALTAIGARQQAQLAETNAAASAASSSADATATAADRVQTGLDAASTAADTIATAADRVQTGLDATSASNSASAANTSASAASASQIAAASSAASAAAVFSDFEDRYYGPHASDSAAQTHVTGLGLTVDQGDLYFNSTANEMRVYDGGAFIAASSAGGASLINYHYTATAAQTTFSGSDDNSNTLSYTVDNLIVTKNGIVLEVGTDYTATNGTSIVLAVAAAAGDEINVVAFKSFTTADMVSATNGGTFQGNVDFSAGVDVTGNITVTGTVDGRDVAADGTKLDGIEALADVTDATNVAAAGAAMLTGATFTGAVTATSFSGDGSSLTGIPTPTLTSLGIDNHDQLTVDGSGNVDVTGTVTADGLTVDQGSGGQGISLQRSSYDTMDIELSESGFRIRNETDGRTDFFIDGSGNVGIGSSPAAKLHVQTSAVNSSIDNVADEFVIENNGASGMTILSANNDSGFILFGDNDSNAAGGIRYEHPNDAFSFRTNSSWDRMRILSSGSVLVGGTAVNGATRFSIIGDSANTGRAADTYRQTSTSSNHIQNWYSNVGGTATIQAVIEAGGDVESRTNNFTGTSDRTLKENITDANSQWDDIKALQVKNYNFIGEPERTCLGVIAQEVEAAGMTGLVKTSEETNKMSVKYSVLYMKAVKALQEAMVRIETLETEMTALEARVQALETA